MSAPAVGFGRVQVDITAPLVPPRFGLLSVARVHDDEPRVGFGVEVISNSCIILSEADAMCVASTGEKVASEPISTGFGESFSLYALNVCRLPGAITDAEQRLRSGFAGAESRGVEQAFIRYVLASPNPATTPVVDLTGGVGTNVWSLSDGIAMLEDYAGQTYGGQAVLHLPRGLAYKASRETGVVREGDHLETSIGTLVSAGGGYAIENLGPNGSPAPDNHAWLWITGQVDLWRGPLAVIGPTIDRYNEYAVLGERTYAAAVDCLAAAVLVSTGCCSCDGGVPD